jgi:hypothetical protein
MGGTYPEVSIGSISTANRATADSQEKPIPLSGDREQL